MKYLIYINLIILFIGCSKYEPLEMDFNIGDKNSEWKNNLVKYSLDDGKHYSYNLNGKKIKLNLAINENFLHSEELNDESLVEMTITTKYNAVDLDEFTNLLKSLYGFNNIREIEEYNKKINEMKSKTNPLTGLKMAQSKEIIKNKINILNYFKNNTHISESIEWNYERNNYELSFDHLNNLIWFTISNKLLLDKISSNKIKSYKKDDYIEFNSFKVERKSYRNYLYRTDFNFKVERRLSSFDNRTVNKVKFNILIKDEFGYVEFTKQNLVETLPYNFTNGMVGNLYYSYTSRDKSSKNLSFESEVISVILSDGTIIK